MGRRPTILRHTARTSHKTSRPTTWNSPRPRRDVVRSRDCLETETSRPRPHPCICLIQQVGVLSSTTLRWMLNTTVASIVNFVHRQVIDGQLSWQYLQRSTAILSQWALTSVYSTNYMPDATDLQQLLCMLPIAVVQSFSDGVAICYALPVLWMTSNCTYGVTSLPL